MNTGMVSENRAGRTSTIDRRVVALGDLEGGFLLAIYVGYWGASYASALPVYVRHEMPDQCPSQRGDINVSKRYRTIVRKQMSTQRRTILARDVSVIR